MTLTLNFQDQIRNSLYPHQNGPIATKQNANISIGLKASNLTIGFDLGRDLELSRSKMESVISWPKLVRLPRDKNANISIELYESNVTFGFELGHDL